MSRIHCYSCKGNQIKCNYKRKRKLFQKKLLAHVFPIAFLRIVEEQVSVLVGVEHVILRAVDENVEWPHVLLGVVVAYFLFGLGILACDFVVLLHEVDERLRHAFIVPCEIGVAPHGKQHQQCQA